MSSYSRLFRLLVHALVHACDHHISIYRLRSGIKDVFAAHDANNLILGLMIQFICAGHLALVLFLAQPLVTVVRAAPARAFAQSARAAAGASKAAAIFLSAGALRKV